MLRVLATSARPGMRLAMPVFHPTRPTTVLLKAGAILVEHMIERLQQLGVGEMWIAYPGLEQIAECASEEVVRARAQMTQTLSDAFEHAKDVADPVLDFRPFRNAVLGLLDALMHNPKAAQHVHDMNSCGYPLLRHATNVAYISMLIGLKLDFYLEHQRSRLAPARARDVCSLGLGAILHDIGAMKLEPEVLAEYLRTGNELDPQWQPHVTLGFEMVRGNIDASAATVVLHHHQRYDGTGFPARRTSTGIHTPAGNDIHIFARIVAAVDLFESLRFPAPYTVGSTDTPRTVPAVRVLRMLSEPPCIDWIDPVVYLGLCAVVPPYAPGTAVTLNDGTQAVVTRWRPEEPCRPVVTEITSLNSPENFTTGRKIDLLAKRDLEIAEVEGEDVLNDNFYASERMKFDLPGVARALINRAAEASGDFREAG